MQFFAGITCLIIAAKIEEIYPPKLQEFAYVTDGACSEEEILSMELVILKGLNWGLSPMTPNSWVKLYLQVTQANYIVDINGANPPGIYLQNFSGLFLGNCGCTLFIYLFGAKIADRDDKMEVFSSYPKES